MYCSKCGRAIPENQEFCQGCGKATAKPRFPEAAGAFQKARFARMIQRLSHFYYLFAALNVVLGIIGLFAVQMSLSVQVGPWEPWPHPYLWNWTLVGGVAWTLWFTRVAFALAAGWGLSHHVDWGRIVTMVAAAISFLEFPIGLVLAVFTFSLLFGKHRARLYEQIQNREVTFNVH